MRAAEQANAMAVSRDGGCAGCCALRAWCGACGGLVRLPVRRQWRRAGAAVGAGGILCRAVGAGRAGAARSGKRAPKRRQHRPRGRLLRAALRRPAFSARAYGECDAGRNLPRRCARRARPRCSSAAKSAAPWPRTARRYADLDNAYIYRKQLVANCTCNGKDAFGLAPFDMASDPTLRPGDIVSTKDGLMAFTGKAGSVAQFTPVDKASIATASNSVTAHRRAVAPRRARRR